MFKIRIIDLSRDRSNLLVQLALLQTLHLSRLAGLVESEPLRLRRFYHRVVREFHEDKSLKFLKVILVVLPEHIKKIG